MPARRSAEEVPVANLARLIGPPLGGVVPTLMHQSLPHHAVAVRHRQPAEPVGKDLIRHPPAEPVGGMAWARTPSAASADGPPHRRSHCVPARGGSRRAAAPGRRTRSAPAPPAPSARRSQPSPAGERGSSRSSPANSRRTSRQHSSSGSSDPRAKRTSVPQDTAPKGSLYRCHGNQTQIDHGQGPLSYSRVFSPMMAVPISLPTEVGVEDIHRRRPPEPHRRRPSR